MHGLCDQAILHEVLGSQLNPQYILRCTQSRSHDIPRVKRVAFHPEKGLILRVEFILGLLATLVLRFDQGMLSQPRLVGLAIVGLRNTFEDYALA